MEQNWDLATTERYWAFVSMVAAMITLVCIGYMTYRFTRSYVIRRQSAAAAGVAYAAVMIPLYFIPWEMGGMFAYAAGTAAAFMVLYVLDREKLKQKLFLGLIMYLLDWIAHGITGQIRSFLFWAVLDTPYMLKNRIRGFCAYIVVEIFCIVVRCLAMAGLIWIINRIYVGKQEDMNGKELALMLVTPLLVLAGYGTFTFISNLYEADLGRYIWHGNPSFSVIQMCYQLLSYPAIVIQLAFYQKIKDSHKREKETAVLAGQLADMKKHIHEVEGLYREIRGLKHEMGNHIMVMEQLVQQEQQTEATAYLAAWRQQLSQTAEAVRTGNPVTDVVLTEKQRKAREQGIELVCEFAYPPETNLNAFDISILLNNALDNAIEASAGCEGPIVHLRSWRRKNVYMMEIRNPFAGDLVLDSESGLPRSTKEGREHGLGLANMRKVAGNYMGDIDVGTENGMFVLTVMLMVE